VTIYVPTADRSFGVPDPPATEVVNAAITLFATTLPLYNSKVQESILEQISSFLSSSSLQRDPARREAISVNIAVALLSALKVAVKDTRSAPGDLRGEAVERVMQELLHVSARSIWLIFASP
jgi:HEAT repeat-containing protein 5